MFKLNAYFYPHRLIPVLIWALVIFGFSSLSSLPGASFSWFDFVIKKSGHMIVFGVLYLLVYRSFKLRTKSTAVVSFLLVLGYALSDEFHQSFVPGRTATLMDVGFDCLGASMAYIIQSNQMLPKLIRPWQKLLSR